MMDQKDKERNSITGTRFTFGQENPPVEEDHSDLEKEIHNQILIGRITPEVIHDINNQLTGILGYAELLSMKKINDQSILNGLANITLSAERCKNLLANVLSLARQSSSLINLTDLNGVIDKTIDLRSCAWRHQQIEISKELARGLSCISINMAALQKIILHLIFAAEAALEELPENRRLYLQTAMFSENQALIAIRFNALKFSPDPIDRKSGLDLNSIEYWIHQLGGEFKVESTGKQGIGFLILLPVKG